MDIPESKKFNFNAPKVNSNLWWKFAYIIKYSVEPCRVVIYLHDEQSRASQLISGFCQTKLDKNKHLKYYYLAVHNLAKNELKLANANIKESLKENNEFLYSKILDVIISSKLFEKDLLTISEFCNLLDNYGEKLSDNFAYIKAKFLYEIRVGKDKSKINEYFLKLNENSNNNFVNAFLAQTKDEKIALLRKGSQQNDSKSQLLLFFELNDKEYETEKILLLKNAIKSGKKWPLIAILQKITDIGHLSDKDPFASVFAWLDDDNLKESPYTHIIQGTLNALENYLACKSTDTSIYFDKAIQIFNKKSFVKNQFDYFFIGLVHYYGLSGKVDKDEALYYFDKSEHDISQLDSEERYFLEFLLLTYGMNRDVDLGINKIKKLYERFESYRLLQPKDETESVTLVFDEVIQLLSYLDYFQNKPTAICPDLQESDGIINNDQAEKNIQENEANNNVETEHDLEIDDVTLKMFVELFINAAYVERFNEALAYYTGKSSIKGNTHKHFDRDLSKAFELFFELAFDDVPDAQYQISRMYSKGHGVEQSCIKSKYWMSRALENGSNIAKRIKLGGCNYEGKDFNFDIIN